MSEIRNFEKFGEFLNYNNDYIYDSYLQHYNLIKIIESLHNKTIKPIDAFNIEGEGCYILSMCAESGWLIYSTEWTEDSVDKLHERINFSRFKNWSFCGQRKLLLELFSKFNITHTIQKDRLVYECKTVTLLTRIAPGIAVSSTLEDLGRLSELTYDYSLYEWGERDGRGIDYVQQLVYTCIQQKSQVQWNDKGTICAIAQMMNLENNFPFVGSLYTDKDKRNQGYATSLLYKITQQVLNQGYEVCGLVSDLANPASNKIFKTVGYKPIYEFIILFKP